MMKSRNNLYGVDRRANLSTSNRWKIYPSSPILFVAYGSRRVVHFHRSPPEWALDFCPFRGCEYVETTRLKLLFSQGGVVRGSPQGLHWLSRERMQQRCFQPSLEATDRGCPCQDDHIRKVWSPCSASRGGVPYRRLRRLVQGGRNTLSRSATQVDSETDEDMPLVRQAIPVVQSVPEVFPI